MKINFAQVPHEDVDMFGEENLFGPNEDGEFFYNYVEFGTNPGGMDEVSIVDGCNRYMPISVEHIPELVVALSECYKIYCELNLAENTKEYAESDSEAYVHNSQVKHDTESVSQASSWPFGR